MNAYPARVLRPATSEMTGCPAAEKQPEIVITGPLTLLFSIAVGVIVTSLFAPQTLVGLIGPSLGFSAAASGFVAMVTLLGYAGGLFEARSSYPALIASLWHLLRSEPVLRRRSLTASLAMAAFSLFWTAVALRLAQAPFHLGQRGIALFALVGAGGAAATPLVGRAGDRGWTRTTTIASHLIIIAAFVLAAWAVSSPPGASLLSLGLMGSSAVLLDVGVTGDQTLGRRAINLLQPEARGRINGLFVGLFFLGGAAGAAMAGIMWASGGWPMICATGAGFGIAALAVDCLSQGLA